MQSKVPHTRQVELIKTPPGDFLRAKARVHDVLELRWIFRVGWVANRNLAVPESDCTDGFMRNQRLQWRELWDGIGSATAHALIV
jgi:hypothetical protein